MWDIIVFKTKNLILFTPRHPIPNNGVPKTQPAFQTQAISNSNIKLSNFQLVRYWKGAVDNRRKVSIHDPTKASIKVIEGCRLVASDRKDLRKSVMKLSEHIWYTITKTLSQVSRWDNYMRQSPLQICTLLKSRSMTSDHKWFQRFHFPIANISYNKMNLQLRVHEAAWKQNATMPRLVGSSMASYTCHQDDWAHVEM